MSTIKLDNAETNSPQKILVIKLGALGDFILSYRAMTAIRAHHPQAHLTLMTISSLTGLAEATGLFDEIWTDDRPGLWQPLGWWRLMRKLNRAEFQRVYDLQTARRTQRYYRLLPRRGSNGQAMYMAVPTPIPILSVKPCTRLSAKPNNWRSRALVRRNTPPLISAGPMLMSRAIGWMTMGRLTC